jgi:hypothetical protein
MNFTTHIPHGSELLDVHFNRVASPSGKYFVEVNSGDDVIASFEMQKDHFNKWKVTQPVPQWVIDYEAHLAQVIATNQFLATEEV